MLAKPVAEQAETLWGALEELIQENLFRNFLEPTDEEKANMVMVLVMLAGEIHRTVLTQTSGFLRQGIYNTWIMGLNEANKARTIYDGQVQKEAEADGPREGEEGAREEAGETP